MVKLNIVIDSIIEISLEGGGDCFFFQAEDGIRDRDG